MQVGDEVAGGPRVEAVLLGLRLGLLGRQRAELAGERADGLAELGGAAEGVALPERQAAGDAGRGRDEDAVVGDVLDPPAGGAEREDVADPGLVDHLLVELADPAADALADEEDAEQPAVGDRAAAGDGQALRPGTTGQRAGHAVPHDPRPELGELVGGVAAAEQVERGVVRAAREVGERRRAADQVVELVDVHRVERDRGDDLLGEHVERVGGDAQALDLPGAHPLDRDRGLGEVAAVLGVEDAAAHLADLVAGPAHALQRAGHARRRLDLDDEVDRAHVDAELEAAGGHHRRQATALEVVLDEGALLLADRAVVGLGDDRLGAQARAGLGHDLGRRLGVLLEQSRPARVVAISLSRAVSRSLSRRELAKTMVLVCASIRSTTDSSTCGQIDWLRSSSSDVLVVLVGRRHVLDGHDDLEVPLLLAGRGHDLDRGAGRRGSARPPRAGGPWR